MRGIYRRVWAGDGEVTAWVRNRDRTPLPRRRGRERSPLARRRDTSERTIPHVPPSLSSRPRVGEPLSPRDATRVRPLQPLHVVGAILSK